MAEKRFTRWANITRNTDSDETFLGLEVAGTNKNKRSARLNVFLDSLTSKNYGFMASKIADLSALSSTQVLTYCEYFLNTEPLRS